ncbi:MAG TPA: PEP-CTERM sorting domain-containing protein [Methyloversatilis sp.]
MRFPHAVLPVVLCSAILGLVSAPASATVVANLVANGGFESPDVASWVLKNAGDSSITGWTVVGGQISFQDTAAFGGLGVVASEGSQFLELTGVVGRGGGVVSNAFGTDIGATYRVQFDIGAFFVAGQGSFGDVIVDLKVSGDPATHSFTNALGLSAAGSDWETKSFDFVATAASTTLDLRSSLSLASSSLGVGLDNVRVTQIQAAPLIPSVPEPESYLLMLAGLGVLGVAARRR